MASTHARTVLAIALALPLTACANPGPLLIDAPVVVAAPPRPAPEPAVPPPAIPFTLRLDLYSPPAGQGPFAWNLAITIAATPGLIAPERPVRVVLECGNGVVKTTYGGFTGMIIDSCSAETRGDYVAVARAFTRSGDSISASLLTHVDPHDEPLPPVRPPVTPPTPPSSTSSSSGAR